MNEIYEVRKARFEGKDDCSVRVIIPSKFVEGLKITKGDYIKFSKNGSQVIFEKLVMAPKVPASVKPSPKTNPKAMVTSSNG